MRFIWDYLEGARRLNKEYPPLPKAIAQLCTVVPLNTDYGPATKMLGALIRETDPDTIIISCDDDTVHDRRLVSKLVEHAQDHPEACICGTGALLGHGLHGISIVSSLAPFRPWNGLTGFYIPPEGRNVDLIFGVAGVLYRRGFFPDKERLEEELLLYSLQDTRIYLNDDVLYSGYLSKRGIKRKVFYDIPDVHCHDSGTGDALSGDLFPMIRRMNEAIEQVKIYGFFPSMEPMTFNESVAWRCAFALLIVLLIIALIVLMFRF